MTAPVQDNPDVRSQARLLLRRWLAIDDDAILSAVDDLGRAAIRNAAQASERLGRTEALASSSSEVLRELQALSETYGSVPVERPPSWFARVLGTAPTPPPRPDLNTLVASLERERDRIARDLIAIDTDRARLHDAEAGLERALELVHACEAAVTAAAREMAVDQPGRSAFLRETVAARLLARQQDVLTQMAVTRHGVMALELVADGHATLAHAIDRARDSSVAALRTAISARRAVETNRDVLRQAEALGRTVDAAASAPPERGAVDRALADAVAQLHRAIDAARSPASSL